MEKSSSIWGNLGLFAVTLVIFVFTFPEISPSHGPGIDSPLAWAYNYLFAYDVEIFPQMVFPHGPIAFIMYPLPMGNNLDLTFWILSITKIVFIYTLLRLGSVVTPEKWLLHAALTIMIAEIVHINLVLTGAAAAGLMIFHFTEKKWWLIVPVVFTVIGLYTRASIGITNTIIMVSYAAIYVYQKRDYKLPLFTAGSLLVMLTLFWVMVYGSFEGLFTYFYGTLQLMGGSSAATSYYPDNNWLYLGAAILLFFAFPFIVKNSKVNFIYGLLILSVFAVWKHGMSREDLLHARGFFCYLVLFFTLMLLALEEVKKRHFVIIGIILALVYRNLTVTFDYREYAPKIWSVNEFVRWVKERDKIAEEAIRESDLAVAVHKLPEDFLSRVEDTPVDVYPWDFSFIPANNLEWHPRIVPQAYASYTPWLDKQNADYFTEQRGAEFIIWDFVEDRWGGNFSGIDDRYILNNEPQAILQILDNYSVVEKCDLAMLLEKDKGNHLGETETTSEVITAKWNEWIKVPEVQDGIQRARVDIKGTLWRTIKNQLFKDEAYSVEYKLSNGEIKKYRIVPDLVTVGLWVNPLVMQPQNNFIEPIVTDIRFTCTNYKAVKDNITLQWELVGVNGQDSMATTRFAKAFALFGKKSSLNETPVLESLNDLEGAYENWVVNQDAVKRGKAFSGDNYIELDKGGYSHTFEASLDTLYNQGARIVTVSVNAQVKLKEGGKLALVLSASDGGEDYFWEVVDTEMLSVSHKDWAPVYMRKQLELKANTKLKTFLWNVGEKKALVDDIEVKVFY